METFLCPISLHQMSDPVICADGTTYERNQIERWFQEGRNTSPMTGARLENRTLIPNLVMRHAIIEYNERHSLNMSLRNVEEVDRGIAEYIRNNNNNTIYIEVSDNETNKIDNMNTWNNSLMNILDYSNMNINYYNL